VDGGEEEEEGEKAEDTGPLRAGREEEAEEDVGAMVAPLSAVGVTAAAPGVEEEEGGEGGLGGSGVAVSRLRDALRLEEEEEAAPAAAMASPPSE
jgi:hypothetical protein